MPQDFTCQVLPLRRVASDQPLDFHQPWLSTGAMNPLDLTINQLRRAAAIKERIEALKKELRSILGAPAKSGASPTKKRTMSASVKRKIAAAQKNKVGEPSTS